MPIEEFFRGKKEGNEEPKEEITLQQLLTDSRKSGLFGEYMQKQGHEELGGRLSQSKLEDGDVATLNEQKKAFLERMKQVEIVGAAFSLEELEKFGKVNSKLETFKGLVGNEGISASLLPNLERMAIREPERFDKIMKSFDRIRGAEKVVGALNQRTEGFFSEYKHKPSEEEYLGILKNESDPFLRQEKLERLVREKIGFWKKFSLGKEAVTREARHIDRRAEIRNALQHHDSMLKNAGEVLALTMIEDPQVKEAFQKTLLGEKYEQQELAGFKEMHGLMPAEDDLKLEWARAVKEGTSKPNFEKKYFEGFNRKNKKEGFWMNLLKGQIKGLMSSLT